LGGDVIHGNDGNDVCDGEDGDDQVFGDLSATNQRLTLPPSAATERTGVAARHARRATRERCPAGALRSHGRSRGQGRSRCPERY
jgi:hypothetical protein